VQNDKGGGNRIAMDIIEINKKFVKLSLSRQRSKVRIADTNGNHVSKPTVAKNVPSNYVEWMISNAEIQELINNYMTSEDKKSLVSRLKLINSFLNKSEYATRKAKRMTSIGNFEDFNIYQYEETFFSFEKILDLNIKIRITFKMGDFTLAPHLFILLPFDEQIIEFFNCSGKVPIDDRLGSGCYAIWEPTTNVISKVVEALAHASEGHKRDLLMMVE